MVHADVFVDGHDTLAGVLRYRHVEDESWREVPLEPQGNDLWTAGAHRPPAGPLRILRGGVDDTFATWQSGLSKKVDAGQDVDSELLEGAEITRRAAERADGTDADARFLREQAALLSRPKRGAARIEAALSPALAAAMARHPDRTQATESEPALHLLVDSRAGHLRRLVRDVSALLCRRLGGGPRHVPRLRGAASYVAGMGFDVLYLPPIHPIGVSYRKGPNNRPRPGPEDRAARGESAPRKAGTGPSPGARHARRLRPLRRRGTRARYRDRARPRLSVLARPSMGARASGLVSPAARRHDPVRREPAQEVPGHLSVRLRVP